MKYYKYINERFVTGYSGYTDDGTIIDGCDVHRTLIVGNIYEISSEFGGWIWINVDNIESYKSGKRYYIPDINNNYCYYKNDFVDVTKQISRKAKLKRILKDEM